MPSKTLLASSDLVHDIAEGSELGIHSAQPRIDLGQIIARKRKVITGFADYRIEALKSFPLYQGPAHFESAHRLLVGDDIALEAKNYIIATGSVIAAPPVIGLQEAGYIDSDAVLDSFDLPASIVVLGGGYVGAELGQFLARMGARTTFIIRAKQLLSQEDADVGGAVTLAFREQGITVHAGAVLSHVEKIGAKKVVHYVRDGKRESVETDEIFCALGRLPNFAGLELDRAGVRCHAVTGIEAGADLRTCVPHIFAVGDVTGVHPLVHIAIYQGELAARNAVLGTSEPADYSLQKTHTIFTDPQVAIVGETEKELQAAGVEYLTGSYAFADHGKAIAINKTTGFLGRPSWAPRPRISFTK
jgi:pyruvate/2-oxoglutarate dehydrogenase complex dihydrolipoamide dehydrogenase (E3) component